VTIGSARLLRQKLRPSLLRVIEYERDELYQWLLGGIARRIRPAYRRAGASCPSAKQGKKVGLENETKNEQNNRATDAQVDATELEATAASLIAAVLDVLALVTGRPFHKNVLLKEKPSALPLQAVPVNKM
jgi:hypothetical protein